MSNSFEEIVLQQTGWGSYQKFLFGLSSAYVFCDGFAHVALFFILPMAKCDLLLKEEEEMNVIINLIFGMIVGGWFLGSISDVIERTRLIAITLIVLFISAFTLGFTTEDLLFSVCAFFIGVGVTGNTMVVKINLAEQLPMEKRGACIVALDVFWYAACLIAAGIGYKLHPNERNPITNRPKQTWNFISWRITAGIIAGLSLMTSFTTALLQPNVRSLLTKRRKTTAHNFLKFIYAINHSDHAEKYKVALRQIPGHIKEFPVREPATPIGCWKTFLLRAKRCKTTYKFIIKCKYFKVILLVTLLRTVLAGGFVTHSTWLSRNILQTEDTENDAGCNITKRFLLYPKIEECTQRIDFYFFIYFISFGATGIIILIILSLLIDIVGRKPPLMASYIICGACCLIFTFFRIYHVCILFSVLYMIGFATIESILDIVIIENVPTLCRGTAFGISYTFKHIVDIMIKYFFFSTCRESFLFITTMMLMGCIVSYFIPDRKNKPMVE